MHPLKHKCYYFYSTETTFIFTFMICDSSVPAVLTNELFMQFQFQFADCPKLHLLQGLSETEKAYGLFAGLCTKNCYLVLLEIELWLHTK